MDEFKAKFLKAYLSAGMGSLPKRDVDALVMNLLDEHGLGDGIPLKSFSNQQLSVKLRTPASRIKLLRYEATLKYSGDDHENTAKLKLLEIVAKSSFDVDKAKISIVVEDKFIQSWLQGLLKENGFVADTSFNTEIIKVDHKNLCEILELLYGEEISEVFKSGIDAVIKKSAEITFAELKREFIVGAVGGLGSFATTSVVSALIASIRQ